jgi:hypothetical protein
MRTWMQLNQLSCFLHLRCMHFPHNFKFHSLNLSKYILIIKSKVISGTQREQRERENRGAEDLYNP